MLAAYFIFPKFKNILKKNDPVKTDQSIALLPFVNVNKDSSQEYFSDGLTDGIHNSLSQLKGLKVSARTSSFQFKKKNVDIKRAGKELGVSAILEGSVQLDGDRIIITANLFNVKDSVSLWSAKYDENMDNIFFASG